MALPNTIRALIEPTVSRLGFDLIAVEWIGGVRGQVLRISVDGDRGVSAHDCAAISRKVSLLLDAADPVGGAYTLEVSSPGIERPVQRVEDFERFQGYRARIRMTEGFPRRRYSGVLMGVEQGEVQLEADGVVHSIPIDGIQRAHLILDLEEYAALAAQTPPAPPRRNNHDQ